MRKNILALAMCMFLAACGGTTVAVDPIAMKDTPVTIPTIAPIKTSPVQWQVLKASDMLKIAKAKPNTVIFGLDQTNFQNLNVNLSEGTRYMTQEAAVNKMLTDIITQRETEQTSPTTQGKK